MKDNFIAIRVTAEEKEKITTAAKSEHRSVANYMVIAALEKIERESK